MAAVSPGEWLGLVGVLVLIVGVVASRFLQGWRDSRGG